MSETKVRKRWIRHRGRGSQIMIYLGKQLRFFINESDWKVIPMAAIIAALVGMVIRPKFFVTMEGDLIGAFALTCVAIWNGCFNSIQSICRERAIVKREHRSGMHVSSYVAAHMIYQLLLCLTQTGLTMYILMVMGVQFPLEGIVTPFMIVDIGITILLISYGADMMSLFISSISHTTTGAMTIMPFVLIFQLVFSGGLIPLPAWSQVFSDFTLSNYGIQAIAAQSGYNERPMETAWKVLDGMRSNEIGGTWTVGEILDLLKNPAIEKRRDMEVLKAYTVGEVADILSKADETLKVREKTVTEPISIREIFEFLLNEDKLAELRAKQILPATEETSAVTVGDILNTLYTDENMQSLLEEKIGKTITVGQVLDYLKVAEVAEENKDLVLNKQVTLGNIVDFLENNEAIQGQRDRTFTIKTTVGELFELFGEENVQTLIRERTAASSYNARYDSDPNNVVNQWLILGGFILFFAAIATLSLELIDKDKR